MFSCMKLPIKLGNLLYKSFSWTELEQARLRLMILSASKRSCKKNKPQFKNFENSLTLLPT